MSSTLTKALKADASRYRWVAAVSGSQSAASLELATGGDPVMAIGGFSGLGGNLSLAQFEKYVKAGEIHYYIAGGGWRGGGAAGGVGGAGWRRRRPVASGALAVPVASPGSADCSAGRAPVAARPGLAPPAAASPVARSASPAARAALRAAPVAHAGGGPGGTRPAAAAGGGQTTDAITSWVKAHYKAVTIGGQTVYDLTQPKS